jgi:VIT family
MTFSLPKESPSSASTSEMEAVRPQTTRRQSRRSLRNHHEKHSNHGEVVRDVIIGFADGLTVPFALTAGLSSYVSPAMSGNVAYSTTVVWAHHI